MAEYMASRMIRWAALTSHAQSIIFRLEPANPPETEASFTFSKVLEQDGSSTSFRALLALLWVVAHDLQLQPNPATANVRNLQEEMIFDAPDEEEISEDTADESPLLVSHTHALGPSPLLTRSSAEHG